VDEPRRTLRALAACLLVGVAGTGGWLSPAGRALEASFGLPALFHLRGVRSVTEPVAIVAIDRATTGRIWLPRNPSRDGPCRAVRVGAAAPGADWVNPPAATRLSSWPRCLHGLLVERLREAGARVIVFDMLFRPREPAYYGFDVAVDDARFADAMRAAGNVVIGHKLEQDTGAAPQEQAALAPLAGAIRDAALAAAPFPLPEPREQVRRASLFFDAAPPLPTLPAVAIHAFALGRTADAVVAGAAGLDEHADRALPLLVRTAALRQRFAGDAPARQRLERAIAAIGGSGEPVLPEALRDLFTGPDLRYLDFYGPPGTVATVGYAGIIAAEPAALAAVRGRAVFVGYAESAQAEPHDDHRTVFAGERANMHGVEIAATVFANLYSRSFLRETGTLAGACIVFVAGAAAAGLLLAGTVTAGLLSVTLLGLAWLAAASLAFRANHLWLPLFWPLAVQLPLGALVALAWRHREAILQRARLQRAFANFVPPDVAARLTRNAQALHTLRHSVRAACMATDAHRYTSLAERLAPEALLEFLNRYYEPLFDAVARHGGFVSDVVGDSMVAIWPEGDDGPDTRARVCAACLSLIEGADRLAERDPDTALLTRVGVAWGPIVLAPVGALNHYEYRGVGDAVNTANRLQTVARDLGVRIAVAGELTDGLTGFLIRDLGDYLLKGKSAAVRVVEVVARTGESDAATLERCEFFNRAVTAWRAGDLALARERLESLNLSHPGDGAVDFLLGHLGREGASGRFAIPLV
jgi:adenylate cyclase